MGIIVNHRESRPTFARAPRLSERFIQCPGDPSFAPQSTSADKTLLQQHSYGTKEILPCNTTMAPKVPPACVGSDGGFKPPILVSTPQKHLVPRRAGIPPPWACRRTPQRAQVSAGVGKPPHGFGVCIGMPLLNGTGNSPSPGRPTPGVVKQEESSGGSVDTTKTRSDPQRVRMSSGERPIGAAKGKQPNTEASVPTPPGPAWMRVPTARHCCGRVASISALQRPPCIHALPSSHLTQIEMAARHSAMSTTSIHHHTLLLMEHLILRPKQL